MSTEKRRFTQEESRAAALEAASGLLVEAGPAAVTLKAVSARMGRTHANLLHHFGSAAGLQSALAAHLAARVCAEITRVVVANRARAPDPRAVVDLVFDAFDREGAGALATWMILNGNESALNPVVAMIHSLVDELGEGHDAPALHRETLMLVLAAMGDALLGAAMADALGLPRDAARVLATERLLALPANMARMEENTHAG
ncbi:TetR/AcrR family transcriptional regulator [Sandaracinobacteroides saxicola]|uniref:TetR/AcrR family transcriptional regulator n=1 Tax=Sandaracinobacteroides saxicola TaxID=2759707 RepID=A0A7G5IK65_9SPHN|nr:TetR family transcriptional regulator [Sandaracinobacteroides saxicola]QMW23757.1 TetR/AcrR family transcriptional regulator [Sandaracinobacteroides saxicola]